MKIWEAIKNLCENPKEKYQSLDGSKRCVLSVERGYFRFSRYNKDGVVISPVLAAGGFSGNVHQDYEWELVREPVDFVTAVKAYVEGRNIASDRATYYPSMHGYDTDSISKMGMTFREIINNKWYIEEEVK